MDDILGAVPTKLANIDSVLNSQSPTSLPENYVPKELDIVSGRGKRNWNHAGNVRFRQIIQASVDGYIAAPSKAEKTTVVVGIVKQFRDEGAYFLKQDDAGHWYDIGDAQAREKVGHSLRDQVTALKKAKKAGSNSPTPTRSTAATTPPMPDISLSALEPRPISSNGVNTLSNITVAEAAQSGLSSLSTGHSNFSVAQQSGLSSLAGMPAGLSSMPPPAHQLGLSSLEEAQNAIHFQGNNQAYLHHQGMQQPDMAQSTGVSASNPYGYETQHSASFQHFPNPLSHQQLQHYSSEPIYNRRPSVALSDHGGLELDDIQMDQRHRESLLVLEKFARRPSWRASSINSSGTPLVVDMNQVGQLDEEDERILQNLSFSLGSGGDRRSQRSRFSHTTDSSGDRRLSAMSITSIGSQNLANAFRSSIRRSSMAWLGEMQEQFMAYEEAHDTTQDRRVSALDMLKTLEGMDFESDR